MKKCWLVWLKELRQYTLFELHNRSGRRLRLEKIRKKERGRVRLRSTVINERVVGECRSLSTHRFGTGSSGSSVFLSKEPLKTEKVFSLPRWMWQVQRGRRTEIVPTLRTPKHQRSVGDVEVRIPTISTSLFVYVSRTRNCSPNSTTYPRSLTRITYTSLFLFYTVSQVQTT